MDLTPLEAVSDIDPEKLEEIFEEAATVAVEKMIDKSKINIKKDN